MPRSSFTSVLPLVAAMALACSAPRGGDGSDAGETGDASGEASTQTSGEAGEETGSEDPLEVGLTILDNPDNLLGPFAEVQVEGAVEVVVEVRGEGLGTLERPATMPRELPTAFLWGLLEKGEFEAVARARNGLGEWYESEPVAFSTPAAPDALPRVEIPVHDPDRAHDGLVLFGTTDANEQMAYVGYDAQGRVRWYHEIDGTGVRSGGDIKVMESGRLLLFRSEGMKIIEPWGETILDVDVGYHHDLTPLPEGGYLALVRREETHDIPQFGDGAVLEADGILELDANGGLVQEWWASDHLDVQRWPSVLGTNQPPYDWTHGNAVYWVEARQRVLLSLRHQHWIVAIDWPTGEVVWRLGPGGDFAFDGPPEDWFYNQHSPELQPDGRLLLSDNGNERPGDPGAQKYSRGVMYELDEVAMTASMSWDHALTPFTRVQGDADRMPSGHVLICAGGVINSGQIARIIEATDDAASDAVWELRLPNGENVYRATYVDGF